MSPLARYDFAFTIFLLLVAVNLSTRALALPLDALCLAAFAYILTARCPACRSRLARNRKKWIYLYCAKTCLKCGHDLTKS